MKKFGTRLISAVLAGCMMTSVLPVSAFALEGSTEFEGTVSAQENSDAPAEPSGEAAAACLLTSGNIINKNFIEEHGGSKVYSISGTYTEGIVIDAEDEDVVINVIGETTFDKKDGNKKDCANFITVRNANSVTVNAEGQTIKTAEGRNYSRCFYAADTFAGTAVFNGGTYNEQCARVSACYLCGGSWTFDNLTMYAVERAIETDKGANVTVEGGTYNCHDSTSSTFLIQNSTNSSFNGVTASGAGWVLDAINSWVNVVGGSYSSNEGVQVYKNRPTLRAANNATLNVTNANVTGTYCDVFVTGATANLFGGTYTNTNQYINPDPDLNYESPALKVWNGGTLSVNGAVVDCTGGNAAISSGEPAGSDYSYVAGGNLVVENCTIKNSQYGIYLGWGSNASAELKSATFENNDSDIYLASNKEITISDTFTTPATIKVADPEEGRQLTVAGNANKLNLVGQNDYRVAYDKAQHYYYLTNLEPRYTLTPEGATATIKNGDDVIELTPNDEIAEGTPVTLTAHAGDGLEFAGWTVTVNGVVLHDPRDLLKFPNEGDQTKATFDMPAGDVKVRAEYNTVDLPVDPVDPVNPVAPVDPVLPGVIIGGAVILGAYETGTGIYRLMNMQGLPLPSDRIELAELVWERAGKPEPQNMTDENLYADIDADDTDAQKAAHWMVEQELMKFDEDNNKFHPCFPVSKLRVCLTWQNAKDKGLID
ncbi:InlB B-repeat-containing protein [Faecalibacterium prausnitzii]|uniref:InlB B-repeat-containing protein n=1 Tax=Faecalibacterium TaxID=216851 RepID=UPI0032EECEDC